MLAATEFSEHENEGRELSLEGSINGETIINDVMSGHLSEPIQPDKTSAVMPFGNRSQSTHSSLSALATSNNNQSPPAPSSTDSGSVAHEVY